MRKIELSGTMGRGIFVLVDELDFNYLSQWNWNITPKGYPIRTDRTDKKKTIYLHREVAERAGIAVAGLQVDHVDGDKLDCRRCNLRPATNQQNQANVKLQKNSTTGFKGVTKRTKNGRTYFIARIGVSYKRMHLGCFSTAEEAHAAYMNAAKQHFGEFAEA